MKLLYSDLLKLKIEETGIVSTTSLISKHKKDAERLCLVFQVREKWGWSPLPLLH